MIPLRDDAAWRRVQDRLDWLVIGMVAALLAMVVLWRGGYVDAGWRWLGVQSGGWLGRG